jgi:porphobilinogen deaminase
MKIKPLLNRCKQFWADQGGMEALQTVCIVAIAATVMVGAAKIAQEGTKMSTDNWAQMKAEDEKGIKAAVQNAAKDAASKVYDKAEAGAKDIYNGLKDKF